MIKLAIAEDNVFLAKAIEEKISFFDDLKFKFRAVNGNDLLDKLLQNHNVDVVLMDIQMPEKDGIAATQYIKDKYPHIKILMLTVFDDDDNIFNAIKSGADGYLLKEISPQELHKAIIDVMQGGAAMTPSIALKTLKLLRNYEPINNDKNLKSEITLSNRETEVLEQLAKGLDYQEIAKNLFVSPFTVRKHIENTYKKLQVHNKVEAVQKAIKNKLI